MKKIKIVFKNGVVIETGYSSRVYTELSENLGKDHKVDAKNFTLNTKNIEGIFFVAADAADDAE